MASRSYRRLSANQRYLRGISWNAADSDVTDQERVDAEDVAATEIDHALGKQFSTSDPQPIIRLLADLLGSAYMLEYVSSGPDMGERGESRYKPDYLREKAQQIIDDLRSHKAGIQAADGTWDADYPQPDILPTVLEGASRALTIDVGLAWGQMAQPKMTDAEKTDLDTTRGRRSDEMVSALAGAYGV